MGALRTRFRKGFLISFLVAGLLAGCGIHPKHSEAEMRRHAEKFVSGLEIEVLEEDHQTLIIGWFDPGSPTSIIHSMYELSNSPEEVREKLRALYPAGDVWLEYGDGEWMGEAPLDAGLLTPEKARDSVMYLLLQPRFSAKLKQGRDRLPGIVLLLICPWFESEGGFAISYTDAVAVTEDGHLLTNLHASGIDRCHAGISEK